MGFVSDFSPRPQGGPPNTPPPVNRPQSQPPQAGPRGFFADFFPTQTAPAQQPVESYQPTQAPLPTETSPYRRAWSPASRPETPGPTLTPSSTSANTWSPAPTNSTRPGVSKTELDSLSSEIGRITERLNNLRSSNPESAIGQLEQELSSAKNALPGAKEASAESRRRLEMLERILERNKQMINRLELRQSGFQPTGGWGRGYGGGGRWSHHWNNEFLFRMDELRGPENAEDRQNQMALVLDSRRERVWRLQDEVNSTRSNVFAADGRVKELEQKISRLGEDLFRARDNYQNKNHERSSLTGRLTELKQRYERLAGKPYSGHFW